MSKSLLRHITSFLLYTIVQVVVLQNFNLSEWGFSFVYIGFILFLPIEIPIIMLLVLAFLQGAILDVFYNTLGLHMFTLVILAYLRSYFIRLLAPKMMNELDNVSSVAQFGIQRVIIYVLILSFIHHLFLFFIMAGGTSFIFNTVLKVLISTVVSTVMIIIFQKLFFSKS